MSAEARAQLAADIDAAARLTGSFRLRSGAEATEYFDKYRFEADPRLLARVAKAMVLLVPEEVEVLAGVELGGVPIATAMSLFNGRPAAFVRKEAKKYGTALLAEGSPIAGRQVCVVEDVITTGGQVVISTGDLRALGAVVEHVLCVIDRSPDGGAALTEAGLAMHALLTRAQLDAAEARRA